MILTKIVSILRSEKSAPLLSFIIGVGVAIMLFHKPILREVTLSLPLHEVHGKTVRNGEKCYQYLAEDAECELSESK